MTVLIVWILLIIIVFALAKASNWTIRFFRIVAYSLLKKNKNGGNPNWGT